ncbi:MAG: AI-2E family transporter [Bauldia sp.]|nr:AI-2E family transporter [Bauldia sp.]
MARESAVASPLVQWFLWLAIAGISLLILIYGRPFLLPVVVAFLVFTVLSAGINRVSRLRLGGFALPHWLAASVGLALLLVILLVLYSVVSGELLLIVAEWPRIVERLQAFAARVSDWLGEDIEEALRAAYASFNVVSAFRSVVTPAGAALTSIIVVVLYVAFMFVESAAFPTKVAKLFADDPQRAGEVSEVARQITRSVHRYLLLKTVLSAGNTLAVYAIMRLVGLEFAETWALLTFFLNFIPKIGSITATIVPSLFALLQFTDWQPIAIVVVGVAAAHTLTGEVVEPMVMGKTLNLSSLVIMLSLTFWAMVWGVAGTFLAVPLMVVILIICSKVPMLRPVAILLSGDGDIPVAQPPAAAADKAAGRA